jgi:hypothetical protein
MLRKLKSVGSDTGQKFQLAMMEKDQPLFADPLVRYYVYMLLIVATLIPRVTYAPTMMQRFNQRKSTRTIDLFLLKFEVREPEISSRETNRIWISVTKHIELVFCSRRRSKVSHITQITSSNLGLQIGLAISINLPRIMSRLRGAV